MKGKTGVLEKVLGRHTLCQSCFSSSGHCFQFCDTHFTLRYGNGTATTFMIFVPSWHFKPKMSSNKTLLHSFCGVVFLISWKQSPLVSWTFSASSDHYTGCSEKPQACPPTLTKSCQKAINILIPPSAPTAKPPKGPSLCFFRPGVGCSRLPRGLLGFISQCPSGQLWFSKGHRVGRCGQKGPPLPSSIKYYSPGLRAAVASALALSNAAAQRSSLTRASLALCSISIH